MTRNEQYWIDRADRRMDSYTLSAIAQSRIINQSYNQLCNYVQSEIAKILRHVGDEGTLAYEYRMKRLTALLERTNKRMQELYGVTLGDTTEFLRSIIPEAYYHTIFDIAQGTGYQPMFSAVNNRLIDKIINENWSGQNYSKRIWRNTDALSEKVREILTEAAMSGESIYKTSRRLSEAFAVSEYVSKRLIQTETTYACGQAELASYNELDIAKYKYVATLDERTCPICGSHDGEIYLVKDAKPGVNYKPMHPHCHCDMPAYFGEEYEPKERAARDENGKYIRVPESMKYDEWRKKYVENGSQSAPTPARDNNIPKPSGKPQQSPVKPSEGNAVDINVSEPVNPSGAYTDVPISRHESEKSKVKAENPVTIVNNADINSPEYREHFNAFNESSQVARIMCQESRNMLKHRTGTEYEDLSFIDSNTGKYITRTDYNVRKQVEPSKRMLKMLHSSNPYSIIAIHNHPTSTKPSIDDIMIASQRKYKYGIIACHNGNLYRYRIIGEIEETKENVNYIQMLLDTVDRTIYNKDKLEDKFEGELLDYLKQLRKKGVELEVYLWK